MKQVEERYISLLFEEAEIAKFSPKEVREYEASKMAYRDIKNSIDTVGIIEGSSLMGLSQEEYEALSEDKKNAMDLKVVSAYQDAGTKYIIRDISGLLDILK